MEELANELALWIIGQVAEAKLKGVIFGLSGGLDSTVHTPQFPPFDPCRSANTVLLFRGSIDLPTSRG